MRRFLWFILPCVAALLARGRARSATSAGRRWRFAVADLHRTPYLALRDRLCLPFLRVTFSGWFGACLDLVFPRRRRICRGTGVCGHLALLQPGSSAFRLGDAAARGLIRSKNPGGPAYGWARGALDRHACCWRKRSPTPTPHHPLHLPTTLCLLPVPHCICACADVVAVLAVTSPQYLWLYVRLGRSTV